jgi:hypothetical protein
MRRMETRVLYSMVCVCVCVRPSVLCVVCVLCVCACNETSLIIVERDKKKQGRAAQEIRDYSEACVLMMKMIHLQTLCDKGQEESQ